MSHELSNDTDDALDRLLGPSGNEEGGLGLGTTSQRRHSFDIETPLPPRGTPRRGLHRARQDSMTMSQLFESVRTMTVDLEPLREDVAQAVQKIRTTLVKDLDRMDQGETGFFDMSMTRSLSVLPESIPEFMHESGMQPTMELYPKEKEPSTQATAGPQTPPAQLSHQYFALFAAVLAVSSNATALHMLNGVKAPMKLYWRMTASYCALSLFAIRSLSKNGFPTLSPAQWLTFFAAVFCYSIQGILYVSALDYTTIGNALNYANSQALLLIIGKACVGERIHFLEACGVFVACVGAFLCSTDESQSDASSPETSGGKSYLGDMMALLSAVAGVGYLTFAKAVRSQISVTLFIFGMMFCGSFMVLFFIIVDPSETVQFNMDPYDGVLGWLTLHEFRLPILIYLAIVVNCVGTMGFVRGKYSQLVDLPMRKDCILPKARI
jgi:drug/metabolite transporter (DMT)-like permease